jgi:UDP-glucose 4-epimerase
LTNVLITGVSGFVASHLAEGLLPLGFKVYGTLRVAYTLRLIDVPKGVQTINADLLDLHSLKKAMRIAQPEYVFHLAACSPVMYSFDNPLLYVETNFTGTCHMIQACLESHTLKRFIFASTAEYYGEQGKPSITVVPDTRKVGSWHAYSEEDPPSAKNTPYGITKIAADCWTRMCGDVYGLPYTITRCSNMYGPRTRQRVVEKIIRSMLTENTVKMDGRPDIIRDFMYVKDGVQAYIDCMTKPQAENQVFNFSTGIPTSIEQVVEVCRELIGFKGTVAFGLAPRPTDPSEIILDNTKALQVLGWTPKYDLKAGLQLTIDWWRKQLDEKA